jgi:hypothetical protein
MSILRGCSFCISILPYISICFIIARLNEQKKSVSIRPITKTVP